MCNNMEDSATDLANHNLRKYATALAFSVLKLKPKNVTTLDFCEELKKKFLSDQRVTTNNDHDYSQNSNALVLALSQNDFSESQPVSQEMSQTFNSFKNTLNINENQEISKKVVNEFEVMQAVENVKKIICLFTQKNCFDDGNTIENITSQKNYSQDSGYVSSQNSSYRASEPFKRKQADIVSLDKSLTSLVLFINNTCLKTLNETVVEQVTKVFGLALDELCELNIYLSFYDKVVDILDNIVKNLHNSKDHEDMDDTLMKFSIFNYSSLLLEHSLNQVMTELQEQIKAIFPSNTSEAIELNEPDTIDGIFYLFHLIQIILNRRKLKKSASQNANENKSVSKQIHEDEIIKNRNDVVKNKCTKLLSAIMVECSEPYPLIAFYAMECYNIIVNE